MPGHRVRQQPQGDKGHRRAESEWASQNIADRFEHALRQRDVPLLARIESQNRIGVLRDRIDRRRGGSRFGVAGFHGISTWPRHVGYRPEMPSGAEARPIGAR